MKKIISAVLIIALFATVGICVFAAGGADDPLISLSYLYDIIFPDISEKTQQAYSETLGTQHSQALSRLDRLSIPDRSGYDYAPQFTMLELGEGGSVELGSFGSIVLLEGTAKLRALSGEVINISDGSVCGDEELLTPGKKYFAAEDSAAIIRIYSDSASGMVDGYYIYQPDGELPEDERFADVNGSHWARDYIYELADQGAVNGVGGNMFLPEGEVTRAEFVTILGRLYAGDGLYYDETGFDDADINSWYGPYVAWAAENGIVTGHDDGSFKPDDKINREQMALIMMRSLDYAETELETEPYADSDSISPWAEQAVMWAKAVGLMNGRGENMFQPQGRATRAEACAVLCRYARLRG